MYGIPPNNLGNLSATGQQIAAPILTVGAASVPLVSSAIIGSSLAIPIIGVAIAGVLAVVTAFLSRKGPKQKTITTGYANEIESYMVQNLSAWNSSSKNSAEQQTALGIYDSLWAELVKACSNPDLGNPGKACIADRSPGGKWDWKSYYRDPISNDPNVKTGASNVLSEMTSGGTSEIIGLVAIVGIGLLLFGGKKHRYGRYED